ncbi:hypothetical protein AVEN_11011-1 [Araneus ventricosus]|uniref:Uncharacterized protein n=1 Tax=Araneus ventricosus TaxID=182803 RepID=A0A4Y2HGA7_ARAVE|nr:hypothetical protein AVEN_11011-1 [Araneus ventricosus]
MSRFGGTRGLFWDGPRNIEPRSGDEEGTWAGTLSPSFRTTPTGGRLTPTYDLVCNMLNKRRIFSGIGFRAWNLAVPKPRPYHWPPRPQSLMNKENWYPKNNTEVFFRPHLKARKAIVPTKVSFSGYMQGVHSNRGLIDNF